MDILERLEAIEIPHFPIVTDAAAEIRRLRAALAVVADPRNWSTAPQLGGGMFRLWSGRGEYADPMAWAKSFVRDPEATEPN